jgi:hypothetical protein
MKESMMTCASCGGACGPEALKRASNEMLLAELNVRRESATKQRDEFYRTHWTLRKYMYIGLVILLGVISFGMLVGLAVHDIVVVRSMGITALSFLALFVFILFKDGRVSTQFKKEYPKEAKLLYGQ